ncbi:hypothetical protein [Planomonospora parontospora]|nr:hypothetical protein [Planomonospora parontospora]
MGSSGNARGWALPLAVLTSFVLAAVAVLFNLEVMSWVAAGFGAVLGVVALFKRETSAEEGPVGSGSRLSAGWVQKALIVGGVLIFGAAVALRIIVNPVSSEAATPCAEPSDPITRAKVTSTPPAAHPGLELKSALYSIKYNRADSMTLEISGQITTQVPDGQLLYPFKRAEPGTRDHKGNPGSGRFFWGRDAEITLDQNGCWYQQRSNFGGYSGARGLTFYYYVGLVPRAQLSCMDRLVSTKAGKEHGQDTDDLTRCGVTMLGYAHIPTDPL